jgi:hypothetical protein
MKEYSLKRPSNGPQLEAKYTPPKGWLAPAHVVFALAFASYVIFCLFSIAQISVPDIPFYGLKMVMEDARLSMATDPAQHASLALTFATERVREIVQIADRGQEAPELVLLRLQNQLHMALQDATRADEQDKQRILAEVNDVTKQLQDTLTKAEPEVPIATRDALRQAFHLAEQIHLQAE